ncbi:glycosyltransferase [Flavobacterium tegetincola]|uniref:glycosyltransferase n=1 Tax=Flavobacterium tegetincola TaxID=150172 RepID=UPI000410C034|nr:glycosyltransferase [Flavobacterium tegetincola]
MTIAPEKIVVSVAMVTYNHEHYIREAIESVLSQEYEGKIELIIANDQSTDNTEKIILEIIHNHKNGSWIKYTNHPSNLGMKTNFNWALNQGTGKYTAICEGDDYWTDPLKLQKQVQFLENNPEYVFSFHSADLNSTVENKFAYNFLSEDKDYSSNELFMKWIAPTASFVFLSSCMEYANKNLYALKVLNPDLILALSCLELGKARGISEAMSVYRIHQQGISQVRFKQNRINHLKNYINHYKYIGANFPKVSKKNINIKIVDTYSSIAQCYFKKKNILFLLYSVKCFRYRPELVLRGFKKIFKA